MSFSGLNGPRWHRTEIDTIANQITITPTHQISTNKHSPLYYHDTKH